MPKRSNPFQRLIKGIEAGLASTGVRVTESAMVPDRMGEEEREVDVLLEGDIGGHDITVAIETRDHERTQDVTWIDNLEGKYRDLAVDRLIAVSSSGFTSGALEKADRLGIKTLTLEQALATEWPDEVLRLTAVFVSLEEIRLDAAEAYYVDDVPEVQGNDLKPCRIVNSEGDADGSFEEVVKGLFKTDGKQAIRRHFQENTEQFAEEGPDTIHRTQVWYETTDRYLEAQDGRWYELQGIRLDIDWKYQLRPADTSHYSYGEDYVTEAKLTDADLGEHSLVIVQPSDSAGEEVNVHYQAREAST